MPGFATVTGVSVTQTVLVFVGIPVLVVALLALMVFGPSQLRQQSHRYRPGKAWTYPPVWYLPRPHDENTTPTHQAVGASERQAISSGGPGSGGPGSGRSRPGQLGAGQLGAGQPGAGQLGAGGPHSGGAPTPDAVGGASGEW